MDKGNVADDNEMHPVAAHRSTHAERIITVQPLKRSEMQVRVILVRFYPLLSVEYSSFCLGGSLQSSYAQDLGSAGVQHGFYGNFINGLGACIGICGAIVSGPVRLA